MEAKVSLGKSFTHTYTHIHTHIRVEFKKKKEGGVGWGVRGGGVKNHMPVTSLSNSSCEIIQVLKVLHNITGQ